MPSVVLTKGQQDFARESEMKVLLVEDDQQTSELLSATLSAHRYAVDAIADGSAGLDLATQWSYDLILLDLLLPTLSGIEVCRRLRAQNCQTPILMLTTKAANEDVIAGLDAGADDYVAKSCDSSQLLARVRALLRRSGSTSSAPLLTWESLCLDPASAQVTYEQKPIALRPKEYNLLELFLRHPQRIFSRSAIIDHLWSMEEAPVEGSVTNLIKDLRHRLKSVGVATDMVETVYGLGYRLKAASISDRTLSQKAVEEADGIAPIASAGNQNDWDQRSRQGKLAVQQVAERFRVSLEQRITRLETVARSLQAGDFSGQQQQAARIEAHKLAGGLGTFGYVEAAAIAQTIEYLLEAEVSQESQLANQLAHCLEQLKQAIAQSPPAAIV